MNIEQPNEEEGVEFKRLVARTKRGETVEEELESGVSKERCDDAVLTK